MSTPKGQLALELFETNSDYIGDVISEDPYIKILGSITWSERHKSPVALAQFENLVCIIAVNLKEVRPTNNEVTE